MREDYERTITTMREDYYTAMIVHLQQYHSGRLTSTCIRIIVLYGTVHSTGILEIPRTVLRAASTAVAECSCAGINLATGSPQLDNTISKPYCLFPH